jgi:hypothetical protein
VVVNIGDDDLGAVRLFQIFQVLPEVIEMSKSREAKETKIRTHRHENLELLVFGWLTCELVIDQHPNVVFLENRIHVCQVLSVLHPVFR